MKSVSLDIIKHNVRKDVGHNEMFTKTKFVFTAEDIKQTIQEKLGNNRPTSPINKSRNAETEVDEAKTLVESTSSRDVSISSANKSPKQTVKPRTETKRKQDTFEIPEVERPFEHKNENVANNSLKSASNEVILVMTVEISEGVSDAIEVRELDDPSSLAQVRFSTAFSMTCSDFIHQNFCRKNKLPAKVIGPLTSHIENNLIRVVQQKSAQSTPVSGRRSRPSSAASRSSNSNTRTRSNSQKKATPVTNKELYDRLHNQAKEKAAKLKTLREDATLKEKAEFKARKHGMSWVSQQMTTDRNTGDFENYGERLYVEGILNKEKKLEIEAKHKKEVEEKEKKKLQTKPKISALAPDQSFKQEVSKKKVWSRLHEPNVQVRQAKIDILRRENEIKEMEQCTFQPKISNRSKQIVGKRTRALEQHGVSLHDQLYQEAEQRDRRLERYACWFPDHVTFQPSISEAGMNDTDYVDVVERLYAKQSESELRLSNLKAQLEMPMDRETGQAFFQPKTGRPPLFQRNVGGLPIGSYLYGMRYEFDDKKEFLHTIDEQNRVDLQNLRFITDRSENLVNKLKKKKFKEIFKHLDTDEDGIIDLSELNLEGLSQEIIDDVLYAASATEHKDDIDLEEFTYLMEHAVEMRVIGIRNYLQPDGRPALDDENLTFHPNINSYSQKLAQKRREEHGYQVYNSLYLDHKVNRARLEDLARELEEARMAECTFHPKLNYAKESLPPHSSSKKSAIKEESKFYQSSLDNARSKGQNKFISLQRELEEALHDDGDNVWMAEGSVNGS